MGPDAAHDFRWEDGERLIRFAPGAAAEAPDLLAARGFDGYALLTTERTLATLPALADRAAVISHVPSGPVARAATAVLSQAAGRPLVALGGGRVIDSAKTVAAIEGVACAAVPTTLSGAELSRRHRLPEGVDVALVRPSLVVADPALMASAPAPELAASAMNALGHALEALYVPNTHPVAQLAALGGAAAIARSLATREPQRDELALGALLAAYALGATALAVHHVVCQTLVAVAGTPHAQTNAVMLPHSTRLMAQRSPEQLGRFARALGAATEDPSAAAELVAPLAARAGVTRLGELGVGAGQVEQVVDAVLARPQLADTPDPPGRAELTALVQGAL